MFQIGSYLHFLLCWYQRIKKSNKDHKKIVVEDKDFFWRSGFRRSGNFSGLIYKCHFGSLGLTLWTSSTPINDCPNMLIVLTLSFCMFSVESFIVVSCYLHLTNT